MMGYMQIHRRINALKLAGACAQLGARMGTTSCISGLSYTSLRYLLYDRNSENRGRNMASVVFWYEKASYAEKAHACMFATIFMRIYDLHPAGPHYSAGEALIDSYTLYAERCHSTRLVSIDRAFLLACHLKGIWKQRTTSLLLHRCSHCGCQSIIHRDDVVGMTTQCIFCEILKKCTYAHVSRLFPLPTRRCTSRSR
ncbi:FlhC family transcriptional regulator [Janthinobacterium sp. PSPC3-1]|uniref:FlhC family transcriptional regulator n=1 Tax=Janthinobacterium sp. PSPC3-1 TaxID=2804653 RepID=UPI003CE9DEA8